jgi:YebC/PmpR family DNA-binding regulatory protein
MAGHSHASNVAGRKAKSDAVKGRIYSKIGREIAVAVRAGGADPSVNSKLYDAVAKARLNNMPGDNIKRCIQKASGELGSVNYESMTYEGYGPGGAAVIVEALTDNKNRTVGDVRHIFDKYGGSLGAGGCVSYLFDRKGVFVLERGGKSENDIAELALEAGADDYAVYDEDAEILTAPAAFPAAREYLEKAAVKLLGAEITLLPQSAIDLPPDARAKFAAMAEKFDELDDVQNVYHNVNLDE